MVVTVRSLGLSGLEGYPVFAECFLSGGLPAFDIVGLPDAAVREARERVRAAVKNCGARFPVSRITVNLAPAGTRKAGTVYDLPVLLCKPVHIKASAWIGAGATILPGVCVGRHAVVGAGSVVTKDVPDYAVVVGNPARVVKMLDKERFSEES